VWTPSLAGTYVLRATATTPFGGTVPVSTTVRIVAAGGGIETDNGAAPRVLDQSTQPRAGAKGVPTSSFITVAFSEPVVGVSLSTVHLTRADIVPAPATAPETPEAFRISGVTAAGQIVPDVLQAPTLPITAITIQAISGLKYHQTYTLRLTDGIRDLDTVSGAAAPRSLAPYETSFQTFGPEAIPPDEDAVQSYTTTGFYVARDANGEPLSMWALKHQISGSTWMGLLTGLDVSDPMNISETSSTSVFGRPVDLAGESTTVVVGTAPGARSMPSNVHLYDVSNAEAPAWLGSVSVANSAGQGALQRLALRGNRIYAGTLRRGIQVIDVDQLRSLMVPCCSNAHFKMRSDLNLDGQGFGTEAIAATIPVPGPNGLPASFTGLKTIATGAEPLIVAAGNFGLALARESAPGAARVWHPEKDGITLERADALDVTDVGGYSLAVVAGIATGRRQLMVVDVTDPTAPFVRSVREIAGDLSVVDVLADGATVYVSPQKTTTPAALAVQVFEISDPQVIAYLGEVSGVAGRLALVGKLLYGATNGTFGAPVDGLGGVRTAALGTVALIEGTNPAVVVVGEGPRAAEDFKLKYRVIPSSAEVESARIEYRHSDATVGAPVAVALDPQGRGELPLSLGFTFPAVGESVARPRLVVRTPGGDEIVGPVRSWRHDQPTLELVFADEQEDYVSADDPQVKVELVSAEWARRAEVAAENGQPEPPAKAIAFEALLPPASVSPAIALSSDGFFETTLHTSTQPQQDRFVRAKVGEVLLAETAAVAIEPGEPSEANSTLESSKSAIPADDLSKVLLTLVARDQHGNLVGDGTPIIWEKGDGADGEFVEAQEGTSGGRATVEYRAGVNPGPVSINVHVGEALLTTTIQQAALGVVLLAPATRSFFNKTPLPLEVQVTSAAGPVANGTKVGWFSTTGRVGETQPTTDGVARAAWDPTETTWRPRVDFVAVVGQGRAQQRMSWTRTVETGTLTNYRAVRFASLGTHAASPLVQGATEPRHVAVSPSVVAGDIQGDQLVPFERADGTFEQVPVKATASYQAFGLVPGERVTVRLGTNRNPNVAPILHFTGEEKEGTVVPDATGAHDGRAADGVSLKPDGYRADAFTFGGSGLGAGSSVGITVPDHPDFAFPGGFVVQAAVRPPPAGSGINDGPAGAGTLIKKGNGFALDLVELNGELRARFTIQTATGPEFVTSSLPVAREDWSLVTGKYESGRIFVGLENALESTFISSAPVLTPEPLEVGPGFRGDLDEIRVFDLTQAPLSTFGNGQQALSFVADQSGEFQTPILATGALSAPRIAAYYQSLSDEARSAIGGPNAEDLASPLLQAPGASAESGIGLATIEAETYWNDTAETATTRIGFVSASTMAFFAKLSHAVVIGSGGAGDPPDLALVAGDVLGSIFLSPVTILRDVANSSDRLIRGSASGQDGLDLALGVVNLGASLVKGKASALLKLGPLAKAITRTGKGSKTIARLIAFETSLAAGASGVSRIKKLVEVVNCSATAATLVGGILDAVGDDEEAVANVDTVLANAKPVPNEPLAAVAELNRIRTEPDVSPAGFKLVLAGFAAPFDEGAPAADTPGLRKLFMKLSPELAAGGRAGYQALVERGVRAPFTIVRRIVKSTSTDRPQLAEEMLDGMAQLSKKALNDATMQAMTRRLGSARALTKTSQQFVMKVMRSKVAAADKVGVEFFASVKVAGGRTVNRFYDLAVQKGNLTVFYEVKNWKLSTFTPFPPGTKGTVAYSAWRSAKTQFMKDMINLGTTPGQIKWVFPAGFLDKKIGDVTNKQKMAEEFLSVLNSNEFKKYVGRPIDNPNRYRDVIVALGGVIDPQTGRGTVPSPARILAMLESIDK
jgi:hypothetical protein